MDTDGEGEDRAPRRRRRNDDDEDDDDDDEDEDEASRDGRVRMSVGEDLSHRIVELRTPNPESDDASSRPSSKNRRRLGGF